jgi:hypothetical protein
LSGFEVVLDGECRDGGERAEHDDAHPLGSREHRRVEWSRCAIHDSRQRFVEAESDRDRNLDREVDIEDDEWCEGDAVGDGEDSGEEEAGDERDQRGHLEADVLGEVVVELSAVLDGMDDGGEVVVGEDHDRGVLGDLGAGDAHRHADVGLLQCRRVVDSVAGHRHDIAALLQ